MASILDGKTLVALGDSLIYGNQLGNDKTWIHLLAQKHHMKAYNYGENGNPVASQTTEPERIPMCVRYRDMVGEADYVVILGGANDKRLDVPIGEISVSNPDITTFAGALNTLIGGVTAKYPRARLLLMTNYNRWPNSNRLGLSDIDYVDAMLKIASFWSIPCFDNYRNIGISFQNPAHLSWIDEGISLGLPKNHHFSEEAYVWLLPRYESLLEGL
ncbi:MAG: SGNH/GDSL hydrolase family protein [Hungatella sp.]|nr:SGNH/GDSL hydrolase family protein [Hungatella sp.]